MQQAGNGGYYLDFYNGMVSIFSLLSVIAEVGDLSLHGY
jgi:hypothetical protein